MKRYALACSHLPHAINGTDLPLVTLMKCCRLIAEQGGELISSAGALHWNLQLCSALISGIGVHLICSKDSEIHSLENVKMQFPNLLVLSFELVKNDAVRDSLVLSRADLIYAVWHRNGGRIHALLSEIDSNRIAYDCDVSGFRFRNHTKTVLARVDDSIRTLPDKYLWHWTRSPNQKWPDETEESYGIALLESTENPRTALSTVHRIIASKQILGSTSMIAHGEKVVCFTENHPRKMSEHFSWRTGRHRMNFEPYGIGFPRELLQDRGVVPVQYGESGRWDSLHRSQRWESEREWRFRGDFDFSDLIDQMIVIVSNKRELSLFQGFVVHSFQ